MPLFRDISHDTEETYTLTASEQCVFFVLNRPGHITFTLTEPGATAHVIALYTLHNHDTLTNSITQIHQSPKTESSFIGRSILFDNTHLHWQGLIHIEKMASQSEGRQEIRNLLLSTSATALTLPSLEIENDAVHCSHAATTSTLPKEEIFFLKSRGLSEKQSEQLLIEGFLKDVLARLPLDANQKNILLKKALC